MHSELYVLFTTSSFYSLRGYAPIIVKIKLKGGDVEIGSSNREKSHSCVT